MADTNGAVDALVDRASRGELVLFIGNDALEKETGRPGAQSLALGLSQSWKETTDVSLFSAAEGLHQWQIRAYLAQVLPQDVQPGPLLQAIARLPIPFLATMAVDNLLEKALQKAERPASVLIDDRDLSLRRLGQPDLIKVIGDLGRPASLVVTGERLQAMPDKRRYKLYDLINTWLTEKCVLFIGCDPAAESDFERRIFRLLTGNVNVLDNNAYLVWPEISTTEIDDWQEKNVTIIDRQSEPFLVSLASKLDKVTISFADDPEMIALRGFLKRLQGTKTASQVKRQQQKVPTNQWITTLRVTLSLGITKDQTVEASMRVEFDPDIDEFEGDVQDTGISLRKLRGWAQRAESARDSGSFMSGSKWRSVETSGIEIMEEILPESSPERRYYLQALYLRQTFADALSLVIEVDDDRLSAIPWELLHDGRLDWDNMKLGRGFLGLQYPIYRRRQSPTSLGQISGRIEKALVIAADPTGQLTELDKEIDWLKETLKGAGVSQVDVRNASHPDISQPEVIKALLRDGGYQLLHFTGHGIHDRSDPTQSHLLLGRRRERNKALSAAALAQVARSKHLVLVFMSACNVGVTEESIRGRPWDEAGVVDAITRAGVPATVGMRWVIGNQNARALTETFYKELSKKTPIAEALMIARQAIVKSAREDQMDWANPILTKRHGVLS